MTVLHLSELSHIGQLDCIALTVNIQENQF